MKKIPIGGCPAGPELDAAVAVAQGLHIDNLVGYWKDGAGNNVHPACVGCDGVPTWHPSGDIAAAWGLAKEMVQDGYDFYVDNYRTREGSGWDANYRNSSQPEWKTVSADKAPLAITRAFLLAHGVTEVEIEE